MKYLFIGDIHNKYRTMKHIAEFGRENKYKMVFVGDYTDSFNIPYSDGEKCLKLAVELNDEGHVLLLGNHDLHYLYPTMIHNGFNEQFAFNFKSYLNRLPKRFAFGVDDILVTHAGLTEKMITYSMWERSLTNETLDAEKLAKNIENECVGMQSPLINYSGAKRGGKYQHGGIIWCDYYDEYIPTSGLHQIFGHTFCREFKYINYKKTLGERHDVVQEMKKEGWYYNRYISTRHEMEFFKPTGIQVYVSNSGYKTFNIDCLDDFMQVLEYDSESKQFKIIEL